MIQKPDWLPEIVSVNGEWEQVLRKLYGVFTVDFKEHAPKFEGRPVFWDKRILAGEKYEEGFWHLITRTDYESDERLLDPRRAERLPWCNPTINHSRDAAVMVWDFREANRRVRSYVWLYNWDYVIIFEKRPQRVGEIAFLVTAYHVDGESSRRKLQRKYAQRVI